MWPLALTFGLALASSGALTCLALWIGRKLQILDHPDQERKQHAQVTPRTGGTAVCFTLIAGTLLILLFGDGFVTLPEHSHRYLWLLTLSTGMLCLLGLWDDKWGMQARGKLIWQIIAIIPFVCWGHSTSTINLFGWRLEGAALTVPLILFWLVSCTNFVNLIDGLDGLAGTVGLIIALAVSVLAWQEQRTEISLLAILLAGSLSGFLLHNWPPARIFLGDSGSLPLGFLVGALSLEASAKKAAGLTLAVPFVLLAIPMFDTSMAILRRKLNGRRIGQGDRAHIHHCLRDRGLSPKQTLLAIGGLCAATAGGAIVSAALNNELYAIGTCAILLGCLVAGRVFGFDEAVLLARHLEALLGVIRRGPRALRTRFALLRMTASVESGELELWQKIVRRARRLPGTRVEFVCEHRPSRRRTISLNWGADPSDSDVPGWHVAYTIPRGEGMFAHATARGELLPTIDPVPYQELAEMLALLCRGWPVHVTGSANAHQPERHTGGNSFDVLPPHWPLAPGLEHDPTGSRNAIGTDAA